MRITEIRHAWARPLEERSGPPEGVVIHHAAASRAGAAEIHRWHLARRWQGIGWKGIGYHYVVRKSGAIERGRPESARGSHTLAAQDRIGVCVEGDLTTERMTPAQAAALSWLVHRHILARHPGLPVTRHSDHAETACPGRNMPWPVPPPAPLSYEWIDAVMTSAQKDAALAAARALGLKLVVRAGVRGMAIVSAHADTGKGDSYVRRLADAGVAGARRLPSRSPADNSVRRLNLPTDTVL